MFKLKLIGFYSVCVAANLDNLLNALQEPI